jgi:hypothetical protein
LNRVPELPNAHDGSSIAWWASCSVMDSNEVIVSLLDRGWIAVPGREAGDRAPQLRVGSTQ